MKKFRRAIVLILCLALAFTLFAACGEKNGDNGGDHDIAGGNEGGNEGEGEGGGQDEPAQTYTVTLSFDGSQGSVQVSPPQSGDVYAENETVTVTVQPAAGFVVKEVLVNGTKVSLSGGKYEFAIKQNTTVSASFTDLTSLPDVQGLGEAGFGYGFRGEWVGENDASLYITTDTEAGVSHFVFNGAPIEAVTADGSGSEQTYRFALDGTNYLLSWARNDVSVGYVLAVLDLKTDSRIYYVREDRKPLHIVSDYIGDWEDQDLNGDTLTVTETGVVFNGKEASFVVDGEYQEMVGSPKFAAYVYKNIYFFIVDNNFYVLSWYRASTDLSDTLSPQNPTVNERSFVKPSTEPYHFSDWAIGEWTSAAGNVLKIGEDTIEMDGQPLTAKSNSSSYFLVNWNEKRYEVSIYAGLEGYVLQFTCQLEGGGGMPGGIETVAFVNKTVPGAALASSIGGVWQCSGQGDITIDAAAGTITWNNKNAVIIAPGEQSSTGTRYLYYIMLDGKIGSIMYYDEWAGYDVGDPLDTDGDGFADRNKAEGDESWVLMLSLDTLSPLNFTKKNG